MVDLTKLFGNLKSQSDASAPQTDVSGLSQTPIVGANQAVDPSVAAAPMQLNDMSQEQGGTGGFLKNVLNTIMGTPDQDLTPTEQRQRNQDRSNASAKANQAMQNQGDQYMDPPTAPASGFGLQDIANVVQKLFR